MRAPLLSVALLLVGLGGCDDDAGAASADAGASTSDVGAPDQGRPDASAPMGEIDPTVDGPYAASFSLRMVPVGDRALPVSVWGPTEAAPASTALDALVLPARAAEMATLMSEAPDGCVTPSLDVAVDGALLEGPWPLVMYSHCHECLGVSGATLARRLATWGHVVVAPDHVSNTLWDARDGTNVPLNADFLQVRGADISGLIDAVERGEGPLADLRPLVDLGRVGVAGHSFGAVTAGWVAERDARVDAAYAIAAPVENPLLRGVTAANITAPTVMLVAVEDNSIQEIGNRLLRQNFDALAGPAIKVEVADAGHWSVSDICGLVDAFIAGCGEGTRQTDETPFTYLEPALGRDITATWGVALFGATLHGDEAAAEWLRATDGGEGLEVSRRSW